MTSIHPDNPPDDEYESPDDEKPGWGSLRVRFWVALTIVGLAATVLLVLAELTLLVWPLAFSYAWKRLHGLVAEPWARLGVTSGLVLVAVGLFFVREQFRKLYGIVEMSIGVTTIWFGLTPSSNPSAATLAVAGGVYVIIRGLDNYTRGVDAAPQPVTPSLTGRAPSDR